MKKNKGFTLAELLIVVAIIAVLVAISIPIFTNQLHKSRVATDWANVRSHYAEIQYDYLQNESINSNVLILNSSNEIKKLNGSAQELLAGKITVYSASDMFEGVIGYIVIYTCDNSEDEHYMFLSATHNIIGNN